jgi:hypothetical protein
VAGGGMSSLQTFVRQRARLAGGAALLALLLRLAGAAPASATLDGLAAMLSRSVDGVVDPADIRWEPGHHFLTETLLGRRLLFLAAPAAGQPRDLYRARVRVSLDGKPISVWQLRNLTETPIGDDVALELQGTAAVYATVALGRIQGISVLDVDGIREEDRPQGLLRRALLAVTSWQTTGSLAGIGRADIVFDVPARRAKLTFDPPVLQVDLGAAGRNLLYDVRQRVVRGQNGGQAYGARAVVHRHDAKPLVLWAVDTVRAEVGPGPIAWLEDKVFGARDVVKRGTYALFASADESALRDNAEQVVAVPALDSSRLGDGSELWPPPPIPSLWKELKPGEGEWEPVRYRFLRTVATAGSGDAPAYFYRTFIRPDAKRPYSTLLLIAMDMRQLELGMQAGYEDPKPLTGPPGAGHLPRDSQLLDRIVATFNGAFKTTHGAYGMMVDGRVLVPPVVGAATLIVDREGRVGMGNWPQSTDIPKEVVSFRQNLDPLVEDGVVNPSGRYVWGWQITGTSVMTQRSALCVTPPGHLYYAWGAEIDAPTLSQGLRQAGCAYAMHLDMNPGHCGFVYTDIVDLPRKQWNLRTADPAMSIDAPRYVQWSAKDFFYVMVRDPAPPGLAGVRWKPDGGIQPTPSFIPGVWEGSLWVGSLEVGLLSFDAARVAWRVRSGAAEPTVLDAPPKKLELSGEDRHRVLASVGLGHTTGAVGAGLSFGKLPSLPYNPELATLIVDAQGRLSVLRPGEPVQIPRGGEAVQLPLLAAEGRLVEQALAPGAMQLRGALCVAPGGRTVVGRARHDSSAPVATALLRVGCTRVVELDRGSRHPSFVHRAGSATPPLGGYETTVLYALGQPLLPRGFRWKPVGSGPSTKPTLHDVPRPRALREAAKQ